MTDAMNFGRFPSLSALATSLTRTERAVLEPMPSTIGRHVGHSLKIACLLFSSSSPSNLRVRPSAEQVRAMSAMVLTTSVMGLRKVRRTRRRASISARVLFQAMTSGSGTSSRIGSRIRRVGPFHSGLI